MQIWVRLFHAAAEECFTITYIRSVVPYVEPEKESKETDIASELNQIVLIYCSHKCYRCTGHDYAYDGCKFSRLNLIECD